MIEGFCPFCRSAADEEIERFVVQIGNDLDSKRKARYNKVTCSVDPNCSLSPATRRMLERTFGALTPS